MHFKRCIKKKNDKKPKINKKKEHKNECFFLSIQISLSFFSIACFRIIIKSIEID
jgi:hypothetical protein